MSHFSHGWSRETRRHHFFEYDVAICYPILLHYVRTPYRSFHSASYHALYNQGVSKNENRSPKTRRWLKNTPSRIEFKNYTRMRPWIRAPHLYSSQPMRFSREIFDFSFVCQAYIQSLVSITYYIWLFRAIIGLTYYLYLFILRLLYQELSLMMTWFLQL